MKEFEHGGNIHKVLREQQGGDSPVYDFSANINPLGPPDWIRPLLSSQVEHLIHYPDPEYTEFIESIATFTGKPHENIVIGNGTTELLYTLMRVIPHKRVLIPVPSYVDYSRAAKIAEKVVIPFELDEALDFELDCLRLEEQIQIGDAVIIANPNNPTGLGVDQTVLANLIERRPDALFIIDEAFLDFIDNCETQGVSQPNIITINSMTKFFGVPGLRIGFGLFPTELATKMRANLPPWTVNSFAQAVGIKALEDEEYQKTSRKVCRELRIDLSSELQKIDQLKVYPGSANYLFVKILKGGNSIVLAEYCLKHKIVIRKCDNYQGLNKPEQFFRIAVRTEIENKKLVDTFQSFFNNRTFAQKTNKAASVMFQGTCSDAGKSIITAALCRILFQDGVKVAPFKAQNMSLNSFVTLDGGEMGRAQVVQAQAARLDPDCRMNPVLLKPNSDTGSQVIVSGKPVGNMSVRQYNQFKPKIWSSVCASYDELTADFDAVVLEGAGSPGEVNLKADDIVNMRMAQYAKAPVILIGDIDRGGVYSSFVGIMEVLCEWERNLVEGFLVNKFRGDASLLDSAHDYVKMHTGRSVYGVVPFLPNLGLPEEDSVSFKKGLLNRTRDQEGIDIAVISLPHISNFTDIEPFLDEPDVTLRIVENSAEIGSPQAIIIPGSKNVIHDLHHLQSSGFADEIVRCVANDCVIVGICGGYQMLGKTIQDPYQIESDGGEIDGMSFLNMTTTIERDKQLTRKKGIHNGSQQPVFGYEIHHGISSVDMSPLLSFDDQTSCGLSTRGGNIWGSYLHGIFDSDNFRRWFIDELRVQKGIEPLGRVVAPYDLEAAFDRLADCVREHVDIDSIYRLMRL